MTAPSIVDAEVVEVGRIYTVPHVWVDGRPLPIIGDAHIDEDIDPRVPTHWHIDWRFAPFSLFERISAASVVRDTSGIFFSPPIETPRPGRCYGLIITMEGQKIYPLEMMCLRELPAFDGEALGWFAAFEASCVTRRADSCAWLPYVSSPRAAAHGAARQGRRCHVRGARPELERGDGRARVEVRAMTQTPPPRTPRVVNVLDRVPGAVLVDRTTKWGNPFIIGRDGTRTVCCDKFDRWLPTQRHLVLALHELKGKDLACHCTPRWRRCHATTLLRLANGL